MMTRVIATLALVASSAISAHAQLSFPSDDAIRALLKQRVDEKRSAGIVVGLIEPSGRTRIIAYGDPGEGKPALNAQSVFEIGSITKVFTATLLAQMADEGIVRLDDPVQKYLPATVRTPTRNGKQITLAMLAEQNSGLPALPSNFKPANASNPYVDYSVPQLYEFLSHYELTRDPGRSFEYSNLGVGLLGHVLSLAAKKSYEQLVAERITTPLGMTHTSVVLTPWMNDHLALGHAEDGSVTSNWDFPTLPGAGAIRSTAEDMLKFASANLHPERGPLQRAMDFAQAERAAGEGQGMQIGLNWVSTHVGKDTVTWHNGRTGGYQAFLGLIRAKKEAVVVLTNSGTPGADDLGMHLLEPSLPLAPKPQPPKQRVAITLPLSTLTSYIGRYQLTPNVILDVTADSALYLQATGQGRFRLWPETDLDFFLRVVDAQITFVKAPSGVVQSLILHQNGRDQVAKRIR